MAPQVKFHEEPKVVDIEHYRDISKEEANLVWFSKQEASDMRREYCSLVKAVKRGDAVVPNDTCLRGLESLPQHTQIQLEHTVFEVVTEFYRQQDEGICEPEIIRKMYVQATQSFRKTAKARGARDAKAAGHEVNQSQKARARALTKRFLGGGSDNRMTPSSPCPSSPRSPRKNGLGLNFKRFVTRARGTF